MGASGTQKKTYRNILLKGFIIEGEQHTTSWRKAKYLLESGVKLSMAVRLQGSGSWKTSTIINMFKNNGKKTIETEGHYYEIVGKAHSRWIKEAKIVNPEGRKALSTKNREDLFHIKRLIEKGYKLRAEVTFRGGGMNYTSEIKEIYPYRRKIITANQSVYRW